MKTFSQFIEEAYLVEMRKEDKVKGKKKTPLYVTSTKTKKRLVPGDPKSGKKWKIETQTTTHKAVNPPVAIGRFAQGQTPDSHIYNYKPHPHGKGGEGTLGRVGSARGVKKVKGDKSRAVKDAGPDVIAYSSPKERIERKRSAERTRAQSPYLRRFF